VGRGETHPLCVNLVNICQPLRQHIARHLIPVLVSELGSLGAGTSNSGAGIGDATRHHASHVRRELEDVRDRGGVEELVLVILSAPLRECRGSEEETNGDFLLRDDDCAVFTADSQRGDVGGGDGFEGIFFFPISARRRGKWNAEMRTDLVEPSGVGEDGDVTVETGAACSSDVLVEVFGGVRELGSWRGNGQIAYLT
jgi:hypothetical protein